MSRLTFRLREQPPQRVDLSGLSPEKLNRLGVAEIAALPIHTTRAPLKVGDLFDIADGERETLEFEGGSERFDRFGAGLSAGALHLIGGVGIEAGRGMTGGVVTVEGSVGDYAGSGLRGGVLRVGCDAGDWLGGPRAGETEGMNGGAIHVAGAVGARAGDRMRRGFMMLEGDVGDYAGSRMIAGTIAIAGKAGALPGYLMNRGTILLFERVDELGPTFLDCGVFELVAVKLLAAYAENVFNPGVGALFRRPMRRFAGDMAALGKGEILAPAD